MSGITVYHVPQNDADTFSVGESTRCYFCGKGNNLSMRHIESAPGHRAQYEAVHMICHLWRVRMPRWLLIGLILVGIAIGLLGYGSFILYTCLVVAWIAVFRWSCYNSHAGFRIRYKGRLAH